MYTYDFENLFEIDKKTFFDTLESFQEWYTSKQETQKREIISGISDFLFPLLMKKSFITKIKEYLFGENKENKKVLEISKRKDANYLADYYFDSIVSIYFPISASSAEIISHAYKNIPYTKDKFIKYFPYFIEVFNIKKYKEFYKNEYEFSFISNKVKYINDGLYELSTKPDLKLKNDKIIFTQSSDVKIYNSIISLLNSKSKEKIRNFQIESPYRIKASVSLEDRISYLEEKVSKLENQLNGSYSMTESERELYLNNKIHETTKNISSL